MPSFIPARTSLLLEFDIAFQSNRLQDKLEERKTKITQKHLNNNNNSETDPNQREQSKCVKTHEFSSFIETSAIATINTGNQLSISQIYQGGQETTVENDFLLCRIITPIIKATTASKNLKGNNDEYLAIVDDPDGSTLLRLQLRIPSSNLTIHSSEEALKSINSQILPLGTKLLIRNPMHYFDSKLLVLRCEVGEGSSTISILDENANETPRNEQWLGKIPTKYLNLIAKAELAESEFEYDDPIATKVQSLWNSQKYSAAVCYLSTVLVQTELVQSLLAKSLMYHQQSMTGQGYPIYEWLSSQLQTQQQQASQSSQDLDCAEYQGPVSITAIEGKGRGLIATKFIPKGALILANRAFVVSFIETELFELTNSRHLKQDEMEAFDLWTNVLNSNKIAKKLLEEDDEQMEMVKEVYKLFAGPELGTLELTAKDELSAIEMERIANIVKFNGIANRPCLSTSKDNSGTHNFCLFTQQMTTGVWLIPAYINHSCSDCNVFWRIWGNFLFVRAFKDIREGEEILMPYRGGLSLNSYNERAKTLFRGMNFSCDCSLCHIESSLSRTTRQAIADCLAEVQIIKFNELGTDSYREGLLSIIDELKTCFTESKDGNSKILDIYLYQPLKVLAMTLIVQATEAEGGNPGQRAQTFRQVATLLEEAHELIQDTSEFGKAIGCCLDLICAWIKLDDPSQVLKWYKTLRSHVQIIYGCGEDSGLDDVVEMFLKKYRISTDLINKFAQLI